MWHLRMAVMHLPTEFCANSSIQFGVIDIFQNPRWRRPPSWIYKSCKFGTFRHVNSVVLELYIKFGSNICYSHWDQHTYAPDVYLMTVTRINFWFRLLVMYSSRRDRVAYSHIIWCRYMYPVRSYWHFSEIQDGSLRHLGFLVYVNWPFRRVDSVVFVFFAKFGSNIRYSHWDPRTYASDLHFMTSRELTSGFDFWSCGHLRMAVLHLPVKFGAYIFIQCGVIDIFFKINDGGRRHLGFVWVNHATTHEASFVVRTSCKKFVMIG